VRRTQARHVVENAQRGEQCAAAAHRLYRAVLRGPVLLEFGDAIGRLDVMQPLRQRNASSAG
jgi:hypothetical protein